jgi:hypothetical protein
MPITFVERNIRIENRVGETMRLAKGALEMLLSRQWLRAASIVLVFPVLAACSSGAIGTSRGRQDRGTGAASGGQSETIQPGPGSERLDLVKSVLPSKMQAENKVVRVLVDSDPVFNGARKEYLAIKLSDVLALMKSYPEASAPQAREDWGISFWALDRFRVTFPVSKISQRMPYLAFKEVGQKEGKDWSLIPAKKEAATPAPFYLVWKGSNTDSFEFPVPYQVAFITLEKLDQTFNGAVPSELASRPGFRRYSTKCIMCHAVNFVGGLSQKDLNVPTNYTEKHLEDEFVEKMRTGPGASNCPMVGGESETVIRQIWVYLKDMADQKVCDSEVSCGKKDRL